MKFLEPWEECVSDSDYFNIELARELSPEHILYGVKAVAKARRCDCDDVLFKLIDFTHDFAVVHLTYSKEANPVYPLTQLFINKESWINNRMKPDNEEYNSQ